MLVVDVGAADPSGEAEGAEMNEQELMTFVGKGVGDVAAMVNGLRDVLADAGFTTVRRVAETPFTMVLEARA
jgi:hypothetical protein